MGKEEMDRKYSTRVDEQFPQNLAGEPCREDLANRSNYMYSEV
jgi:hypothetical protein